MSSYSILSEESGGSVVRHRGGQLRRQSSLCFRPFRRALSRTKYAVTNMFNFDRINHKQINILWLSCQIILFGGRTEWQTCHVPRVVNEGSRGSFGNQGSGSMGGLGTPGPPREPKGSIGLGIHGIHREHPRDPKSFWAFTNKRWGFVLARHTTKT
jgi:hypothetical protein